MTYLPIDFKVLDLAPLCATLLFLGLYFIGHIYSIYVCCIIVLIMLIKTTLKRCLNVV
jgi:hypothetical protein